MTKLLVTSDWHLDWKTHGVDRFDELVGAVHQTVTAAIEHEVDVYLFLGDLTDPDSGSCVFRCVETALEVSVNLKEAEIPSIWMAGNHDVIEDGSGDTTLSPLHAIGGFVTVAERPGIYEVAHGISVLALPYAATSHAYDPEAFVREQTRRDLIVMGHLSVPGVIPGEETKEMPRGREVVFPTAAAKPMARLMMNGHYHRQQTTPDGIHIPGSLARLTFGEERNHPSFLIVEVP